MVQHLQAYTRPVLCVCGVALASLGYGRGLEAATEASISSAVEGVAIFTMGDAPDRAPSVCGNRPYGVLLDTGEALAQWPRGVSSVGTMRSSADRSAIVAGNLWGFYGQMGVPGPDGSVRTSIYVLACPGDAWDQCVAMPTVRGTDFYVGVEVMSDADTLLVSTAAGREVDWTIPAPPFRVEKYSLSEIRPVPQESGEWATHVLGPRRGAIETQDAVVAIMQDPDGHRAHLLTRGGPGMREMALHTVDVADMTEAASRIELPLLPQFAYRHVLPRITLSPDGRLLVATRPGQPNIAVVDLISRSASLVELAGSLAFSDVSYSYGPDNRGLLALYTYVAEKGPQVVIAGVGPNGLTTLGRGPATPGSIEWPAWALEWTPDGRAVVASVFAVEPGPTAALLLVEDSGRRVTWARDLTPCSGRGPMVLDIVTAGGVAPPTPTQPAQTPSATASAKPSATVTASPTSTATPTRKATPTVPPRPLYLPLALRESCKPGQRRVDVALVIDASTTMRDDRTVAGRTKLDAAIEAATFFVGVMSLPSDQAAVVVFNETSTVLQPLTGRRADVDVALRRIGQLVREQTRIDLGIEKGHGELTSTRRNAANDPVLILLTDGLANPVSASVAVQRADSAKADHITIFTIGLGQAAALNVVELAQMASRPQYFYRAPDGEDLQGIYRTIAVEIPCPASQYWGGR